MKKRRKANNKKKQNPEDIKPQIGQASEFEKKCDITKYCSN